MLILSSHKKEGSDYIIADIGGIHEKRLTGNLITVDCREKIDVLNFQDE